jgi:hypothetical protein
LFFLLMFVVLIYDMEDSIAIVIFHHNGNGLC